MKTEIFVISLEGKGVTLYLKSSLWKEIEITWSNNPEYATYFYNVKSAKKKISEIKKYANSELKIRKVVTTTVIIDA